MNCYEIALPDASNDPTSHRFLTYSYSPEREHWEARALRDAGGFTYMGLHYGQWRDPKDGKVYEETMHWYRGACDQSVMDILVDYAFTLFKDQEAIFIVKIGDAVIVENPILVRA